MPRRVVFIGEAHDTSHAEIGGDLDLICESIGWDPAALEHLAACEADLIVPVALSRSPLALEFFQRLAAHPIGKPMLAIIPADAELMRAAAPVADDFIIHPARPGELHHRVSRQLGQAPGGGDGAAVHERLTREFGLAGLVGEHPAFLRVIEKIPLVARNSSAVLITGETGTGKEICARAIHHLSARRHFPFIPVDCAALPENLFESELFGHVRGAFTDAHRDQKGLVALAQGGTLFLDEIDSLSVAAQSKLLRMLQENSYRPTGGQRFLASNVKIVAASNQDLEALVREKRFRADLFFRLNVLRLHLPALRQRGSDIMILARHFVAAIAAEQGGARKSLSPAAAARLALRDWPGNVRELHNVIQRAMLFSAGDQIKACDLVDTAGPEAPSDAATFRQARASALETFERGFVEDMLRRSGGNVTRAARLAQKDRRVFGRLMKRYNIQRSVP